MRSRGSFGRGVSTSVRAVNVAVAFIGAHEHALQVFEGEGVLGACLLAQVAAMNIIHVCVVLRFA